MVVLYNIFKNNYFIVVQLQLPASPPLSLYNIFNMIKKQHQDKAAMCGKVKFCDDQDRNRFTHSLNCFSGQKVSGQPRIKQFRYPNNSS